jgi:hypothetical protein
MFTSVGSWNGGWQRSRLADDRPTDMQALRDRAVCSIRITLHGSQSIEQIPGAL